MQAPAVASASQYVSALIANVSRAQARLRIFAVALALVLSMSVQLQAQTAPGAGAPPGPESNELRELREAVRELQVQVAELKREVRDQRASDARPASVGADPAPGADGDSAAPLQVAAGQDNAATQVKKEGAEQALDFLRRTTIEVGVDTYYGFNFNDPIGRVNLLRAYDVSSNAFSLNQASIILKQDPEPSAGRRFGAPGPAVRTSHGNAARQPFERAASRCLSEHISSLRDIRVSREE
jgi:hypothetical protein